MTEEPEDLSALRYRAGVDRQAGALCWTGAGHDLKVMLVTSRRTGRWVFPKGSIDPGMTAPEAAAQEALEEAGVVGKVEVRPIGIYRTAKIRPPLIWTVEIALYPLAIAELHDTWIEMGERQRNLVSVAEAEQLLEDDEMRALLTTFARGR